MKEGHDKVVQDLKVTHQTEVENMLGSHDATVKERDRYKKPDAELQMDLRSSMRRREVEIKERIEESRI